MRGPQMERRSTQGQDDTPRTGGQNATTASPAVPGRGASGGTDPQAVATAMLVERYATFIKACFIYPDNNQRVQITGEQVLESMRALFGRRPLLEIVLRRQEITRQLDEHPSGFVEIRVAPVGLCRLLHVAALELAVDVDQVLRAVENDAACDQIRER